MRKLHDFGHRRPVGPLAGPQHCEDGAWSAPRDPWRVRNEPQMAGHARSTTVVILNVNPAAKRTSADSLSSVWRQLGQHGGQVGRGGGLWGRLGGMYEIGGID